MTSLKRMSTWIPPQRCWIILNYYWLNWLHWSVISLLDVKPINRANIFKSAISNCSFVRDHICMFWPITRRTKRGEKHVHSTRHLSWVEGDEMFSKKKIVSKEIFLTFIRLQIFFNTIWNHSQEVREVAMKLTSTTNFLLREWKASVHSVCWRVDGKYYRNN